MLENMFDDTYIGDDISFGSAVYVNVLGIGKWCKHDTSKRNSVSHQMLLYNGERMFQKLHRMDDDDDDDNKHLNLDN